MSARLKIDELEEKLTNIIELKFVLHLIDLNLQFSRINIIRPSKTSDSTFHVISHSPEIFQFL